MALQRIKAASCLCAAFNLHRFPKKRQVLFSRIARKCIRQKDWVGAFLVRVGAPCSLRIAFGGRIVRVGSPRSLRIVFGCRIVRFGLGHLFGPRRRAALSSHRVRRSRCPRRLAALSSYRVRRSHSPRRGVAT
jgi:hypothetical protein